MDRRRVATLVCGVCIGLVACYRTVTIDADQLPQYKIDVAIRFIRGHSEPYENPRLFGTVTNRSSRRYEEILLEYYIYGVENAIVAKPYISVKRVSAGDKVRVDEMLGVDPRFRRAELKEIKLIQ